MVTKCIHIEIYFALLKKMLMSYMWCDCNIILLIHLVLLTYKPHTPICIISID